MRIGLYISASADTPIDTVLDHFARAEKRGLHTAWAGQMFDFDALTLLALASTRTRRIELGSWVVPTYPRHPSALAHQALTVQAASGGRLVLGLGVSHAAVVEKRLGLDYSKPLRHMQEYLEVLRPLLAGQEVSHVGDEFRVKLQAGTVATTPPPVLVAALGPKMIDLAGRHADGVAIWLGGPRYLGEFAIPRLLRAARDADRPSPRIVSGIPIAVTRAGHARESAERFLAPSAKLPAYRRVLDREGASNPSEIAVVGDESQVEKALRAVADLGVTDLNAVPFRVAGDPQALPRTIALLGALASQSAG
jgi:5,10-methylenetetrahydromethanopterin reductase